jgi:hypothetical protein
MKELDTLRAKFLAPDIDEEDREDNLKALAEWEHDLEQNKHLADWQQHEITRQIVVKAREAYKDASMVLALRRDLTDTQRNLLWAKQDAAEWIISLGAGKPQEELQRIETEIKAALAVS